MTSLTTCVCVCDIVRLGENKVKRNLRMHSLSALCWSCKTKQGKVRPCLVTKKNYK